MSNELGIVVIGRNEGKRLVGCLNSLKHETSAPIVYVDSGSIDGSLTIAQHLGARAIGLDSKQPFTAARARNEGFSDLLASNPEIRFVQFIDGDCELTSGWLQTGLEFLINHLDVAVVCGRRREQYPDLSVYNRLCDLEWNTAVGEATACGGDSLIRVDCFKAVKGYRANLIAGEEPEMCLRLRQLGFKIWRVDAEMTKHDAAITRFTQWWRRIVRSGYAYAQIARLHKTSAVRIYGQEIKRAIFWGGLLPAAILIGIIAHPLSAVGIMIYPIQIARIAIRGQPDRIDHWVYAAFIVLAKFAEFQGVVRYYTRLISGAANTLIEYK